MMLSPYTVTIYTKQDNPYNVIPDAPIEIRERLANGTSGSLSIIYSDQEGLIPITQTGAKADSNGQFTFYAEAAQYNAIYESQTVPVDVGLTADTLPNATISNISLPYVFDTVAEMLASTTDLPLMKKVEVSGNGVSYNVISSVGAPPNALPSAVTGKSFLENNQGAMIKANQENDDQKDYLSCIPRCIAGEWELLNDVGHETLGVASIEKSDDYRIRINYKRQYEQVNNLTITIDQELAPYGVFCGGNVGTAWSEWTAHAQLTGLLRVSDLSFTSTALITATDTSVTLVDDVLTLSYANTVNGDVPVVSVVNKENNMPRVSVAYGVGQLQVRTVTDLAGFVRYSGGQFEWYPGFDNYIAPSQSGISFSESGGVLTVNHPATSGYDIQVTAFGDTSYNVKLSGMGSSQFSVAFYDIVTGAKITVADTKMILMIKRKMDLKGVIPSGLELLVRGPIIPIKSSNFSNIAGNNFWINGVMQKPL